MCFAPERQKNQRVFTKENLRNQMGQKTSTRCSEQRSMGSQSPLLMEIPDLVPAQLISLTSALPKAQRVPARRYTFPFLCKITT